MPPATSGIKLNALTSIRFFAALWVVLFHCGTAALSQFGAPIYAFADKGFAAVGLFFVLSGFVMAYNYAPKNRLDKGAFWSARFARIVPTYLFSLLLTTPIFLRHIRTGEYTGTQGVGALLCAPLFLQAWIPSLALLWNAPAWSLSAEAFFYFTFPFLVGPIRKLRDSRRNWLLLGLFAAAVLPSLLFCILNSLSWEALTAMNRVAWSRQETSGMVALLNFSPLLRLPEFVAGIVLGCLFLQNKRENTGQTSSIKWDVLAVLSVVTVVAIFAMPDMVPYPLVHNGILLPVWCCFIYSLARGIHLERALSLRWMVLLGDASYGMYILQHPISAFYKMALRYGLHQEIKGSYPTMALLLGFIVILCLVSIIVHKWIELPSQAVLKRLLSKYRGEKTSSYPHLHVAEELVVQR